jgi:hypothetical protein
MVAETQIAVGEAAADRYRLDVGAMVAGVVA